MLKNGSCSNSIIKAGTFMGEGKEEKQTRQEKFERAWVKVKSACKKVDLTTYLVALMTILILSISYFFVFALPKMKRDQLAWEKELHAHQWQLREAYNKCIDTAEADYENYIKLNGTPVTGQPETYSAPDYIWDAAEKNRKAALAECARRYQRQ